MKTTLLHSLFALTSLGLLGFTTGCNNKAKADTTAEPAPAIKVDTAVVTEAVAPLELRLTGTLRGSRETDLAANAGGRVIKTMVERGQDVKQGAILAQLDTSAASLALAEARVSVATSQTQEQISKADCERYEQLKAKGAVTDLEYDQITAKCKTAPLSLQAAKARQSIAAKNVGDGTIRAPFAGVIAERFVDVGEYVQPSSRVVSLAQIDQLRLEFSVPEANLASVKADSNVQFSVAAYPETFAGKVKFVSGAVREATRDVIVEAFVDNNDRKLKPGMFADVKLLTGEKKMPVVPKSATFERLQKVRVYVIIDNHLEERVLQVGPDLGDTIAIVKGVDAGETIAIGDLSKLSNGARVQQ